MTARWPKAEAPQARKPYFRDMRTPPAFIISIPKPCNEPWEAMTPAGGGHHCAACRKTVTDFTGWSDAAIAAFYSKPENATACGRFLGTQLDRPLHLPHQPHSLLYRWVVAAGIAAITLTTLPAGAQTAAPHTQAVDTVRRQGHKPPAPPMAPHLPLTAEEIEKIPVRELSQLRMGLPAEPLDAGTISGDRPENVILIIDGVRRDGSWRPSPTRASPEEIEKMPFRESTLIGSVRPQPPHILRESPMRGTYTGEQIDNLHLRSLDDLLR